MKTARSCCLVALLLVPALTSPARAQTAAVAEATALFNDGKKLVEDNDYAGACEKFETSERLDPQIGTEMNLGKCHEVLGQTASSWSWYQRALEHAKKKKDDERIPELKQRVAQLERKLVHLTVTVPDESRVAGLVVKLNDRELERGEWNQDIPLDPDDYHVTAEAPGRKPWSDAITVKTKDREIHVPKLERARVHKKHDDEIQLGNTNRRLAIVIGGIGLGLAAGATGLALYSQSLESQADAKCPTTMCADAHAVDLNHSARLDGWIANAGWAIGAGSLVGAGIAWYLGVREGVTVSPVVGGDGAGVVIGGRF